MMRERCAHVHEEYPRPLAHLDLLLRCADSRALTCVAQPGYPPGGGSFQGDSASASKILRCCGRAQLATGSGFSYASLPTSTSRRAGAWFLRLRGFPGSHPAARTSATGTLPDR